VYEKIISDEKHNDEFIEKRIEFIKQLMNQRKLKIKYELISVNENLARKIIFCKGA
jgi:ADP-dependent phosphofructokinase/glucokinase